MSLTILTTGGTIDKDYPRSTQGYAFEFGDEAAATRLLQHIPLIELQVEIVKVCARDSQEITESDRQAVCDALRKAGARVVVTHGTDTMIETAQYVLRSGAAEGKVRMALVPRVPAR